MKIAISSGHGKMVRGASGVLDEVDQARAVVKKVADLLGSSAVQFHDDTSMSQGENLNAIVNWHNKQTRDLDVSVHFNAYEATGAPMGCEVLYVSQADLAKHVATAICAASGLKNRGAKKRTDLKFLNSTNKPAILIETCFVDSQADADIYHAKFNDICNAIATSITGQSVPPTATAPPPTLTPTPTITITVDPPNSVNIIQK